MNNKDINLPKPPQQAIDFMKSLPCHKCGLPMGDHDFKGGTFICPKNK